MFVSILAVKIFGMSQKVSSHLGWSKGLVQQVPMLYSGWGFLPSRWDRQLKFSAYVFFDFVKPFKIWAYLDNFLFHGFQGGDQRKNAETPMCKGQLISKCLFDAMVSTKKPTKIFKNFCPSPWKEVKSTKIKTLFYTN